MKTSSLRGLALAGALLAPLHNALASAIDLGAADGFAVLAGSAISFAGGGLTTVTGDIGSSPTPSITGLENLALVGSNHGGDATTVSAQSALASAYGVAAGSTAGTIYGAIHDLGGGPALAPGVYNDPTSFGLTGTLTLDAGGNPNAVWIFQAGTTLSTASGSQVVLINGAQPGNVYWQVGSSATLGDHSAFAGTILAYTSITAVDGAAVDGRLLAENGAVTLDHNTVVTPIPEPGTLALLAVGLATLVAFRRRILS